MSEQDNLQNIDTSRAIAPNDEVLTSKIYIIRDQKVMLDRDLAELYGVETRALKQAVRRNIERFPEDFMFELSENEVKIVVSQFVIPDKKIFGGVLSFAFTEQGVIMLSSVLKSKQAIQIMRIFTRMRKLLADHTEVRLEIVEIKNAVETIAKKQVGRDKNIELLFQYIGRLQEKVESPTLPERKRIGYEIGGRKE